jgi:hypothetical protein
MENHGRHQSPWSGRNRCIGLEDICGYYASGLVPSVADNGLSRAGIPTALSAPASVHYVQGVAAIPGEFGRVVDIAFGAGGVTFTDGAGISVQAAVNWRFALSGELARSGA